MSDVARGDSAEASRLGEVARLFLKLGCIGFGGPAAHIALMREEVVRRRGWLTDQEFLDLVGATNLIPGPNSTEMAIHIGYRRAGWRGLVLAGTCFIVPAMLIVLALAAVYVRYGTAPEATWVLYGVKPVIIAVVAQALWALGRTAVKGMPTGLTGLVALGLYFYGVNEIALLLCGGVAVMIAENARRLRRPGRATLSGVAPGGLLGLATAAAGGAAAVAGAASFNMTTLFLVFVKIGAVLYGSGYVLLAFLRGDFVERLGWLTDRALLDAIAIGQFTPGPVFTTATFIGYVLGRVPGAVVATVGIFLPAFVFVALSHPVVPRLRNSPWAGAALDGVNAASLALMAGVTWQLGRAAIVDLPTAILAAGAILVLIRSRMNSAWLVMAGGLVGVIFHVLRS
ncbi:MAG: chromate efflux transporter [Armatimonadetes bacterium]|nr:chromate efflux transporter [Armatimonadota bacterium]